MQGFPVSNGTFQEISKIDLAADIKMSPRRVLLIQISRSSTPSPRLNRFLEHLKDVGADPMLQVVSDRAAHRFGRGRWVPTDDGKKVDFLATLIGNLVDTTVRWCSQLGVNSVDER